MKKFVACVAIALGMSAVAWADAPGRSAHPSTAQIIHRLSQVLPAGNNYYGREKNGRACNVTVSYLNSMAGPQVNISGSRWMMANVWYWAASVQFGQVGYRLREVKETKEAFTLDFITSPYPFGNPSVIVQPTMVKLVVKKLPEGGVGRIEISNRMYDRFYDGYVTRFLSCGI